MSDYYYTLTERTRHQELRRQAAEDRLAAEFVRGHAADPGGHPSLHSRLRRVGELLRRRNARRTA